MARFVGFQPVGPCKALMQPRLPMALPYAFKRPVTGSRVMVTRRRDRSALPRIVPLFVAVGTALPPIEFEGEGRRPHTKGPR
jgi:hypothetical protein